jgi:hypothetical protein
MFDFNLELEKLKSAIPHELIKPFTVSEERCTAEKISELSGKLKDVSLQVEEIYEIVENNSPDSGLIKTLMDVCELLEANLTEFDADGAGKRKLREILNEGGITVLGAVGERLNPEIHRTVGAEILNNILPEQVIQVVQTGYSYENKVIRKAKVIVTK